MLKLLLRKRNIFFIFSGLIASFLSGCVEFPSTDKLLIFSEGVMPTSQFNSITGRYQVGGEDYWRISNINNRLHLEFCSENTVYQSNFILSQVPNQSGLFVQAFPSFGDSNNQSISNSSTEDTTMENIFFLLKPVEKDFNIWIIIKDTYVAQDYFPNPITIGENVSSIYPVEEVKDFLINYGDAYTQANESSLMEYVDNQSLTCTDN